MKLYLLLHGHHQNPNGCPLSIGEQSLRARKREIKKHKPKEEQPLRLALIRNVKPEELPAKTRKAWAAYTKAGAAHHKAWTARDKAWAAYYKARAAYDKALAACDKALAACDKALAACDKARAALFFSLTPAQWERWHKKVCKHPDCKWTAEHPVIF